MQAARIGRLSRLAKQGPQSIALDNAICNMRFDAVDSFATLSLSIWGSCKVALKGCQGLKIEDTRHVQAKNS